MTQPQDKMRAEFEVLRPDFESLPMFEIDKTLLQKNEEGDYVCEPVQGMWLGYGLAHAYPSAQSQQDALDAARWRSARTGEDKVKLVNTGGKHNPEFWLDIADEQADWSVDAQIAIATQGASNF